MKPVKAARLRRDHFIIIGAILFLALGVAILPLTKTSAQKDQDKTAQPLDKQGDLLPIQNTLTIHEPVNLADTAAREALNPPAAQPWLDVIHAPKGAPPDRSGLPPFLPPSSDRSGEPQFAPTPSVTGISPGPTKTVQGEFLSGTTIPPDTMGAVSQNHILTATNDRIRITDRNGVQLSRLTLNAFWSSILINGAAPSTFDPKVYYDRFNNRFIMVAVANASSQFSATLFAVSQTSDPTGAWNRYSVLASDAGTPANTATGGRWADYPSVGFNKNWIVVNINMFGYGTGGTGFRGTALYVLDKQTAYAGSLTAVSTFFQGTTCTSNNDLGCGFTLAPSVNEDNTSETVYLLENWNPTTAILRLGKITGTPGAPVYTGVLQHPQARFSWRGNANRIGSSGGYAPQRQQVAHAPSGIRLMTNDARIQNVVLRNGRLWATHTVMVAAAPNAPGVTVGTTANPDIRSAAQWWEIDPTLEPGVVIIPAAQAGRIVDPTADNCHNGTAGERASCTTANQVGHFYAFPSISVNKDNDVLVGFTQFSPLTYPSGAYAIRRASDAIDTMRDPVVFRSGQANYNLGSGSGTTRQNRWGDYSASMVDPLNDTDFWTTQEYAGAQRDFGIGIAGPWETWWAQVRPSDAAPTTSGSLIISEFRTRGPQGVLDEFIELYNPGTTPLIVRTTDNSDGWALAASNDGVAVTATFATVPNDTVIPAQGYYLLTRNQNTAQGPTVVYSLSGYTTNGVRPADSDLGYHIDIGDSAGIAIFRTANTANFSAGTRMDSVGPASIAAGLFKEGTGTGALPTSNLQYSLFRNYSSGIPQDTNNNATDFRYVETSGTPSGAGQRLGAPGPQNLHSPIMSGMVLQRTGATGFGSPASVLTTTLIDSTVAATSSPNQVRDSTPVPNGLLGTLSFRRSIVNTTGRPVSRLRFRVENLTTFPPPTAPGTSDLRLLSSPIVNVSSSDPAVCGASPTPCTVQARGLTLEEPPSQPFGGGFNSSVLAGFITFADPMPVNGRINVNFLFGVEQTGSFEVDVFAEAITENPVLAPTAASVSVSGRVILPQQFGVTGAMVTLTDMQGDSRTVQTGKFGNFRFTDVMPGESYVVSVSLRGYNYAPQIILVTEDLTEILFTPIQQRRSAK
jgi:hypothetical protein